MHSAIHVLYVEDDDEDVLFFNSALKSDGSTVHLQVVHTADELYELLGQGISPDVLVLDLNLPIVSGREILLELEKDKQMDSVPKVVLTTSSSERDKVFCLLHGAKKFFTKPISPRGYELIIDDILRLAGKSVLS